MKKKIVYVDMDDTLCDLQAAAKSAKVRNPRMPYPQAEYGFYANLDPLPGAIEAITMLYGSGKFEPWILTAPSLINPLCYTEKRVWVEKHLGMRMVERLIISPNKALLKGDYLIDDNITGKGQDKFEGIVFQYGIHPYASWKDILEHLNL